MIEPVYTDSAVTLYCGDCTELLPLIEQAHLVCTDPPYLGTETPITYKTTTGGVSQAIETTETVGMPWGYSLDWLNLLGRPDHWIIYANYLMLGGLCTELQSRAQLGNVFTWRKSNAPNMVRPVPRMDCEFIVWARDPDSGCAEMGQFKSSVIDVPMLQAGCFSTERILMPNSGKAAHPCQKPLDVVTPFIQRLTEPGDLVIDPFAGTGTTLLAAKNLGRRAIGIELNPAYCEIIKRRLQQECLQFDEAPR
jgi:site-specific DNA-methyltransferase (adenine-specific)